jgi:transcriptional regulator with XRE-family HTH domain
VSDDVRVGRIVQDLRISRGLRQEDVASRAGVSRPTVSRLERGLVDGITVGSLRAISRALGMPSIASLGWRSPEIDRLRDRLHAAMVEQVVSTLGSMGWETKPEHSFSHFGERGSVDVLAWHAMTGALLVVETKTRLWDIQDMLSTLDRKRRLLPGLVAREFGWRARAVGVVLVLPQMSTHRHVVARHAATFSAVLPGRQWEVRGWLARPLGDLRGILYLPIAHEDDIGQRARRRRASKHRKRVLRPAISRQIGPNRGSEGGLEGESDPPDPLG